MDGRFTAPPGPKTSTGTTRLWPEDTLGVPDEEFLDLVRAVMTTMDTSGTFRIFKHLRTAFGCSFAVQLP
jgi:hypothetical protein